MPLDDLSLDLKPIPPSPEAEVEVMARALRLPAGPRRQARAIVRMQLDRLSPLPPRDVLFDLVPLRTEGAETTYALGVVRRAALDDAAFAGRSVVALSRQVEGVEVVFRFHNAGAVADWETRWLRHAPRAALLMLGIAAVGLAGQLRADRWREHRLPEVAAEQRLAAREARERVQKSEAWTAWASLDRADAATRFLCVGARIADAAPNGVEISAANADARQVVVSPLDAANTPRLEAAGAVPGAGASDGQAAFPMEVCA